MAAMLIGRAALTLADLRRIARTGPPIALAWRPDIEAIKRLVIDGGFAGEAAGLVPSA